MIAEGGGSGRIRGYITEIVRG